MNSSRVGKTPGVGGGEEGKGASCLTSVGRVTLEGGTTFSHENTLSHPPRTRQLKHKVRAHAMTGMFTAIFFVEYVTRPSEGQQQ